MNDSIGNQGWIWIVIGLAIIIWAIHESSKDNQDDTTPTTKQCTEVEAIARKPSLNDLLDAIEWVESKGDPDAIGDGGAAVGAYQIHKIYVDDVNRIRAHQNLTRPSDFDEHGRIMLRNPFSYEARTDRTLSRLMTITYLMHYGGTPEEMARKHNGGPQGHKKESTLPYWEKVKSRMESVK